jgi:sRNA-binding protein
MTGQELHQECIGSVAKELYERYPSVFVPEGKKAFPLAIGIYGEIRASSPDLLARSLNGFLGRYCQSGRYLRAMLADGAERRNLNGESVGPVSAADQEHAAGKLAERMETLARLAKKAKDHCAPPQSQEEAPVKIEASPPKDDAPKAPRKRPLLTLRGPIA